MANNPFQKFDEGIRLAPQSAQPATGLDGEVYFDETLQQYFGWKNGAWSVLGSGGFGVNFIQNFDGESSTAGWALYNDGATPIPIDGTGGSATALTFAVTRNPTHVLYQMGSFDLTKSAVNAEGQGVSYDFTIDQGYRGNSMMVQCIYKGSANFSYGAGSFANPSDVSVFMYNVDTSTLVPMSANYLDGSGSFLAVFPTDSTSVNYRLIFHVATTNALAWDFYFDSVVVGPVQVVKGAVMTDWVNMGPVVVHGTTTNPSFGTTPVNNLWMRRNGGNADIRIEISQSSAGTAGSGDYLFQIPSGYSIDTSKVTPYTTVGGISQQGSTNIVGGAFIASASASDTSTGKVVVFNTTSVRLVTHDAANSSLLPFQSSGYYPLSTVALTINAFFSVPILGWSSNMILSSETSTQQILAQAYNSANRAASPSQPIDFDTIVYDTANAITTGSSWNFKAPSNGYYEISFMGGNVGTSSGMHVYVAGMFRTLMGETEISDGARAMTTIVQANAGETIDIRTSVATTISGGTLTSSSLNTPSIVTISKLSTPQTVAFDGNKYATIKDVKTSGTDGGSNVGGTTATRTLNTKNDPYNIVSLSSNQFSLQPGRYKISARAPAYNVTRHQVQLYNITSSSVAIVGSNAASGGATNTASDSLLEDIVTIGVPTTFEIRHYTQSSQGGDGFGIASSSGQIEVYTTVTVEKII